MTDWQPIETAPRDGTPILGGAKGAAEPWKTRPSLFFAPWTQDHQNVQPTHWMPLPEPPK